MTTQQWNEFLDKLDFVQLADRWSLLPLHWLDDELPEDVSDLGRELAGALLEIKDIEEEDDRLEKVQSACKEYRAKLGGQRLSLDARLCPPGSRVSLRYLDPEDLGEGDCLITVGSWDRVGHLLAEKAHPGGEHLESVGDSPVRQEPGELAFRNILLFPDKGTPSPRAFRALCEKTFRQARGLGTRHFTVTHLHLPQTGLADRFAAAELVSAVRQLLRDGPGTTVDILCFSHRNYEDYKHWFDSLKELTKSSSEASDYLGQESESEESEAETAESGDVTDTLRSFARRSTEIASEATASVTRWLSSSNDGEEKSTSLVWRAFTFQERALLNRLYLGKWDSEDAPEGEPGDACELYIHCLNGVVRAQQDEDFETDTLLESVKAASQALGTTNPLFRYFLLLEWRMNRDDSEDSGTALSEIIQQAKAWDDMPLLSFAQKASEEDMDPDETKPPVAPGGSKRTPSLT